jgi:hypothetical protein
MNAMLQEQVLDGVFEQYSGPEDSIAWSKPRTAKD